MRVRWSVEAEQTWQESLVYCIVNYGEHFGKKLSTILTKKILILSTYPESGNPMPLLSTEDFNYRSIVLYKEYKIIYRIDYQNNMIIIIDIVNMRIDYDNIRKRVSGK